MPSLHIPAKSVRGLAPPSALDKLGFEPAQSADELIKNVSPGFILRMNLSIMCLKIEPSRLMPCGTLPPQDSPTPCRRTPPILLQGSNSLSLPSTGEHEADSGRCNGDDEDPTYARGRLPDALMDEFEEGFQRVNDIFTKLGESRGMPWQQVKDHYNRQYSRMNSQNPWNMYTAYFTKHKETELARLPGLSVEETPSRADVNKCYECFKADVEQALWLSAH